MFCERSEPSYSVIDEIIDPNPAQDEHLKKVVAERSLAEFAKQAWHTVEPTEGPVWERHHDIICDHLEAVTAKTIKNLAIAVCPGSMKSLLTAVFWPAWEWTTHPETRWMFASYAGSLSIRDSVRCRRVIESEWYQKNWGRNFAIGQNQYSPDGIRYSLQADQNGKIKFENDKTGYRIATSVGGSATGERANRIICDDPMNAKDRDSEARRTGCLDWWDNVFSNRLCDYKEDCRVVIAQRLHEKDLIGHLLEKGGFEYLCLPTEYDPDRRTRTILAPGKVFEDWRTRRGELLMPARFGLKENAEAKATLGPSGYAAQHDQLPAPAGGNRFQQQYFRYFRRKFDVYELIRADGQIKRVLQCDCWRFSMMDPAGTDKEQNKKACYTVIQTFDVTPDSEMLLIHQYRQQVEIPEATKAALELARRFQPESVGVEKNGLGLAIVQSLKRDGVAIRAVNATLSKEARSEPAEVRMAAGMVYFEFGAEYLHDLEKELLLFPHGEYRDVADTLAHACKLIQDRCGAPKETDLIEGMAGAGKSTDEIKAMIEKVSPAILTDDYDPLAEIRHTLRREF
jgi:predicted phage terminase large subunit-like protein